MPISSLIRNLGIFSLFGGLLMIVTQIWFLVNPEAFTAEYLDHFAFVLILLGMIGIYIAQFDKLGVPGFITFILMIASMSLWLGAKWFITFAINDIDKANPELLENGLETVGMGFTISLYSLFLFIFIFGILLAVKGTLPRIPAYLIILCPLVDFVPYGSNISQMVAGVAFTWLGYALWKGKQGEVSSG
ncbi:hypothetical protein [Neobacillus niacini]|uniref:hypothetical protein n=1 Tax=Neobacillus niacini TaxID=86668 RepID=UPI003983D1FF